MKTITINSIKAEEKELRITFTPSDEMQRFFACNEYYVKYNANISGVGKDVLVIPFVSNVLPLLWLNNCSIKVDKLDKSFMGCIETLRQSYSNMYPMLDFAKDCVQANKLVKNENKGQDLLYMFSGGVDAYNTLINNLPQDGTKGHLFSVIGSDIPESDEKAVATFKSQIQYALDLFDLDIIYATSNFRSILNWNAANELVKKSGDDYWHGMQHGIGLLSLAAPIAVKYNIGKIFIASSFSYNEQKIFGHLTCASHQTIDNNLKIGSTIVIHDGLEYDRVDKVANISNFCVKNDVTIPLHVCWENTTGVNCMKCEKCFRSWISAVVLNIVDPNVLGLTTTDETFKKYKQFIKYKCGNLPHKRIVFLKEMQKLFNTDNRYYAKMKWFKKYNFDKFNSSVNRRIYDLLRKCYRKIFK